MVAAGQSGVSEGRAQGAVQPPGPRVSQTAFPQGPRQAGEGMGLHLLGLFLPPPKLAEHWELSRCDPGRCRGVIPAALGCSCPEPGVARRGHHQRPPAPPAHDPEAPARLVTERGRPAAREWARVRPQRRPSSAGRGPVPARGGRFPRPVKEMRRRGREREETGPCQKRRGPDGPGWRGRDSPVPMARPPQAGREREGCPAQALMGHAGGPGRGVWRCGGTHRAPAPAGGAEARPPTRQRGTGQGGSVRWGRPDRSFPPTATDSAPATGLPGPVCVTAPAVPASCFRQCGRTGGRPPAAWRSRRCRSGSEGPERRGTARGTESGPSSGSQNPPRPLSCRSDTGPVRG